MNQATKYERKLADRERTQQRDSQRKGKRFNLSVTDMTLDNPNVQVPIVWRRSRKPATVFSN